jgi:hypothetical protein
MASKIGAGKAITMAEAAFNTWYASAGIAAKVAAPNPWTVGVKNDGTEDFVTPDIEKSVVDTWKNKGDLKGFERRGSLSSGEAKIDLKLAWPGRTESSFNYHVRVQEDPAIEEARKKQAAADKKIAEEHKAKLEKEKTDKEDAAKKKAEADKIEAARQKKLDQAAATAWNALKDTEKKKNNEKTWKEKWKKDNNARIK